MTQGKCRNVALLADSVKIHHENFKVGNLDRGDVNKVKLSTYI